MLILRHIASFAPTLAAATKLGARLVVLNRRDYPGSAPYTPEEKAQLNGAFQTSPEEGQAILRPFMKERAREIHEFIAASVAQEGIKPADEAGGGGVVLAGWSLGVYWLLAFLRHAGSFASDSDVDLTRYVHRAIIHGQSLSLSLSLHRFIYSRLMSTTHSQSSQTHLPSHLASPSPPIPTHP